MKIWFGTNCFLYHGTVHLISMETILHFTDLILNWIEMILNGRATCLLSHRHHHLLPLVILPWGFPGAAGGAAASTDDGGSRMPLCQQQRLSRRRKNLEICFCATVSLQRCVAKRCQALQSAFLTWTIFMGQLDWLAVEIIDGMSPDHLHSSTTSKILLFFYNILGPVLHIWASVQNRMGLINVEWLMMDLSLWEEILDWMDGCVCWLLILQLPRDFHRWGQTANTPKYSTWSTRAHCNAAIVVQSGAVGYNLYCGATQWSNSLIVLYI